MADMVNDILREKIANGEIVLDPPAPVAPPPAPGLDILRPTPAPYADVTVPTEPKAPKKFSQAFSEARAAGLKSFEWEGNTYHTQTKEETAAKPAPATKPETASPSPTKPLGLETIMSQAGYAPLPATSIAKPLLVRDNPETVAKKARAAVPVPDLTPHKDFKAASIELLKKQDKAEREALFQAKVTEKMKADPGLAPETARAMVSQETVSGIPVNAPSMVDGSTPLVADPRSVGAQMSDYAKTYAKGSNSLLQGMGWLGHALTGADLFKDLEKQGESGVEYWANKQSDYITSTLKSFHDKERKAYIEQLFSQPELLGHMLAESAPLMAAGMVPSAAFLRGGMALAHHTVTKGLRARGAINAEFIEGAGVRAANAFRESLTAKLGIGTLGAVSEGLISSGLMGSELETFILKRPVDALRQDPEFTALEQRVGTDAARKEYAETVARVAAIKAGVLVAGAAGIGSPLEVRLLQRSGQGGVPSLARNAVHSGAVQGGEETVQTIGEEKIKYDAKVKVDPTQKFDPVKAGITGAVSGFAMGSAGGAIATGGAISAEAARKTAATLTNLLINGQRSNIDAALAAANLTADQRSKISKSLRSLPDQATQADIDRVQMEVRDIVSPLPAITPHNPAQGRATAETDAVLTEALREASNPAPEMEAAPGVAPMDADPANGAQPSSSENPVEPGITGQAPGGLETSDPSIVNTEGAPAGTTISEPGATLPAVQIPPGASFEEAIAVTSALQPGDAVQIGRKTARIVQREEHPGGATLIYTIDNDPREGTQYVATETPDGGGFKFALATHNGGAVVHKASAGAVPSPTPAAQGGAPRRTMADVEAALRNRTTQATGAQPSPVPNAQNTMPESEAAILEQINAMQDPSSGRDAVLITQGQVPSEVPTGAQRVYRVELGDGDVLLTTNMTKVVLAKEAKAQGRDAVQAAKGVLSGVSEGPYPSEATSAAVARSPEGIETAAVALDPANPAAGIEAAQNLARDQDTVGIEPTEQVIQQRGRDIQQEQVPNQTAETYAFDPVTGEPRQAPGGSATLFAIGGGGGNTSNTTINNTTVNAPQDTDTPRTRHEDNLAMPGVTPEELATAESVARGTVRSSTPRAHQGTLDRVAARHNSAPENVDTQVVYTEIDVLDLPSDTPHVTLDDAKNPTYNLDQRRAAGLKILLKELFGVETVFYTGTGPVGDGFAIQGSGAAPRVFLNARGSTVPQAQVIGHEFFHNVEDQGEEGVMDVYGAVVGGVRGGDEGLRVYASNNQYKDNEAVSEISADLSGQFLSPLFQTSVWDQTFAGVRDLHGAKKGRKIIKNFARALGDKRRELQARVAGSRIGYTTDEILSQSGLDSAFQAIGQAVRNYTPGPVGELDAAQARRDMGVKSSTAKRPQGVTFEVTRDDADEGTFVIARSQSEKGRNGTPLVVGHIHVPDEAVRNGQFDIGDIEVSDALRRQGIASAMLDRMSQALGAKPSGAMSVFTDDGRAFFDAYQRGSTTLKAGEPDVSNLLNPERADTQRPQDNPWEGYFYGEDGVRRERGRRRGYPITRAEADKLRSIGDRVFRFAHYDQPGTEGWYLASDAPRAAFTQRDYNGNPIATPAQLELIDQIVRRGGVVTPERKAMKSVETAQARKSTRKLPATITIDGVDIALTRMPAEDAEGSDALVATAKWGMNTFNGADEVLYAEARRDGGLIGRMVLGVGQDEAEIDKIWVAKAARREGIATKMLRAGMAEIGVKRAAAPNLTDDGQKWFDSIATDVEIDGEKVQRFVTQPADTVTIDGVERPTTNSNGQPIHPTEEGVRNFWKWFGYSQVVDDQGRPLVVYHGTGADITEFKKPSAGKKTSHYLDFGFHFGTTEVADRYATIAQYGGRLQSDMSRDGQKGDPVIYPVYLSAQNIADITSGNPLPEDVKGVFLALAEDNGMSSRSKYVQLIDVDPINFLAVLQRKAGRKAIKSVFESAGYDGIKYSFYGDSYVVFKPTQIKSAIGNQGTFDGSNPDIRKSTRKVAVSISAATSSIGGLKQLQDRSNAGDVTAQHLLNDIAHDSLERLIEGVPSAKVAYTTSTGLYFGELEPSLGLQMTFEDEDRAAALAALAKFADNYNQHQFHVRQETDMPLGHDFGDGSWVTIESHITLAAPMSREDVQKTIDASGLVGLTYNDNELMAYYIGDPNDNAALQQFEDGIVRARTSLGSNAVEARSAPSRIWVYGRGDVNGEPVIPLETIRGDVHTGPPNKNKTAVRVAEDLAGRDVWPVKQAAVITRQQRALQDGIRYAYEQMPVNDLANPQVRRAYDAAASEVLRQFKALPVKVEVLAGQGEPYPNSEAMRRDVLDNNHLYIFGTEADTFGPPGVVYDNHPLLADSGQVDQNGYPLLFNDLLRAVHDYYAHTMSPTQFGAKGEEAAWKNHMAMTPDPWARWAITSETRGQNSWVNFRPWMENATPEEKGFALQKVGLLPIEMAYTGDREVDRPMTELAKRLSAADRAGSVPPLTRIPSYGRDRSASTTVIGAHFSPEPRAFLGGHYYGTGNAGEERSRIEGDPVLGKQVQFYVDKGNGVFPELNVGTHKHLVELHGLYDADTDPMGLRKANPNTSVFTREVLDAGYIGTIADVEGGRQRVVTLSGTEHHSVPVFSGSRVRASKRRSALEDALKIAKGKTWQTGRDFKDAIQQFAPKVDVDNLSPEARAALVEEAYQDALFALEQNKNAVGWYDLKTRQAIAVMALVHPELNTDENARFAFTWALAVTSNGLKVGKNFKLAEAAYRTYKQTGVMPTDIRAGQAQDAINEALDLFNKLRTKWGIDNLRAFMLTNFTVGEIGALSKDLKPGGEHVDVIVKGAAILGPKIGNGFFSNLYGNFDSLTMDRWLVRTWGRWTGTLLKPDPENTANASSRLQRAALAIPAEAKSVLEEIIDHKLSTTDMAALADAVHEASVDPKLRERMNETKGGEELRLAGNSLWKYLDGQKEAPSGPGERKVIRSVFGDVLAKVKTDPAFENLTMADLQAALWYAEKRLYETAKAKESDEDDVDGYNDDEAPDYANAAVMVARDNGISQRRIDNALKREEQNGRPTATRFENVGSLEQGARPAEQGTGGGFTPKEKRRFIRTQAVHGVRSHQTSDGEQPGTYRRDSGKDGGRPRLLKKLGVTYVAQWKPHAKTGTIFRANGIEPASFLELDRTAANAEKFQALISKSRAQLGDFGAAVYVYPVEDYAGMRLLVTEDGAAGVAVKSDGDIVSVFGTGYGDSIVQVAVSAGGVKLDGFDTILGELYGRHGFRVAARLPWDDNQAPADWNKQTFREFNGGEPDVLFMAYDPSYYGQYGKKDGKNAASYDQAVRAQRKLVRQVQQASNGGVRYSTRKTPDQLRQSFADMVGQGNEAVTSFVVGKLETMEEEFVDAKRDVVSITETEARGRRLAEMLGWSTEAVEELLRAGTLDMGNGQSAQAADLLAAGAVASQLAVAQLLDNPGSKTFAQDLTSTLNMMIATRAHLSEIGRALNYAGWIQRRAGMSTEEQKRLAEKAIARAKAMAENLVGVSDGLTPDQKQQADTYNRILKEMAAATQEKEAADEAMAGLAGDVAGALDKLLQARQARNAAKKQVVDAQRTVRDAERKAAAARAKTPTDDAIGAAERDAVRAEGELDAARAKRKQAEQDLRDAQRRIEAAKAKLDAENAKPRPAGLDTVKLQGEARRLEAELNQARRDHEAAKALKKLRDEEMQKAQDRVDRANAAAAKAIKATPTPREIQQARAAARAAEQAALKALIDKREAFAELRKARAKLKAAVDRATGAATAAAKARQAAAALRKLVFVGKAGVSMDEIVTYLGGEKGLAKMQDALKVYGTNTDVDHLHRFMQGVANNIYRVKKEAERHRGVHGAVHRGLSMVLEQFRAFILTGIFTHGVNLASNLTFGVIEQLLTRPIKEALPGGRGAGRHYTNLGMAAARAVADVLPVIRFGMTDEFPAAHFSAFLRMNKDLQTTAMDLGSNKWMDSHGGALPGSYGKWVRAVGFSPLGTADLAFKLVPYRLSIAMQKASGKPVDYAEAVAEAEYQTFQNKLSDTMGGLQAFLNGHPTFGFIVPFFRTLVNLINRTFDYTPVLSQARNIDQYTSGDAAARNLAVAQALVGAVLSAVAIALHGSGDGEDDSMLSGMGPLDPDQKATWLANNQPMGLTLENWIIPLWRIEPFASAMGLSIAAADAWRAYGQEPSLEAFAPVGGALVNTLIGKSFMSGVEDLFLGFHSLVTRGDASYLTEKLPQSIVLGALVPNALAQAGDITDPWKREAKGWEENFMRKIPGLRENLERKLDYKGQPIAEARYGTILPIQRIPRPEDRVAALLYALNEPLYAQPGAIKDGIQELKEALVEMGVPRAEATRAAEALRGEPLAERHEALQGVLNDASLGLILDDEELRDEVKDAKSMQTKDWRENLRAEINALREAKGLPPKQFEELK